MMMYQELCVSMYAYEDESSTMCSYVFLCVPMYVYDYDMENKTVCDYDMIVRIQKNEVFLQKLGVPYVFLMTWHLL